MTDEITLAEARRELENTRTDIAAYLCKKLTTLHERTGLITSCVTAHTFRLTGGFPTDMVSLSVHNVEMHTDIKKYKRDPDA